LFFLSFAAREFPEVASREQTIKKETYHRAIEKMTTGMTDKELSSQSQEKADDAPNIC
jgi:hypothetical protein